MQLRHCVPPSPSIPPERQRSGPVRTQNDSFGTVKRASAFTSI